MPRTYARYTKEILAPVVAESRSYRQVLVALGKRPAGGSQSHLKRRIDDFELDTSHFTGMKHGLANVNRTKPASEVLVRHTGRAKAIQLRRSMIEIGIDYVCSACGLPPIWNGDPITLEVDHIDEDFENSIPSNVQFLCPNCHSTKKHWA